MIPESFETIMSRNNTTLPAAQNASGSEEMKNSRKTLQHRKNIALIVSFSIVLCLCLVSVTSAASINKRASDSASIPPKTCKQTTPCGWAIYIPFTRRIDYFMKNTCECSSDLACLKTDDDLSVNAYVYRCKPRPPGSTTESATTSDYISTQDD